MAHFFEGFFFFGWGFSRWDVWGQLDYKVGGKGAAFFDFEAELYQESRMGSMTRRCRRLG